jgi:hypothetical protein
MSFSGGSLIHILATVRSLPIWMAIETQHTAACMWNPEIWNPCSVNTIFSVRYWIEIAHILIVGRDSAVGIATRYGLDGRGIEFQWGEIFRTLQTGPEVKRPERGVDHPPSYSAKVKERVQLYLYSPSGPSWPVIGRTLPLPYFNYNNCKLSLVCIYCLKIIHGC